MDAAGGGVSIAEFAFLYILAMVFIFGAIVPIASAAFG
jgi:hypothetical protein